MIANYITTTSTKVDLFASLADTGIYDVTITRGSGSYLTHDSGANSGNSVSTDGVNISANVQPLTFPWDSNTPLYVFGSGNFSYILSKRPNVADVNLSLGSCS